MKILFIASNLEISGFSKSLVYLINNLEKYNIKIGLLLLNKTDNFLLDQISKNVEIITNDLVYEYRKNEQKFIYKLIAIILSGRLSNKLRYYYLYYFKYRNSKIPQDLLVKFMQIDDLLRVKYIKSQYNTCAEYDIVISWEESFCNYLLALKITAKRKIGYIHPDYCGAQFYKYIDMQVLPKLDDIFVIAYSNKDSLCNELPKIANKVKVIPNTLNIKEIRKFANYVIEDMKNDTFTILTVCRLQNCSKALDRAIDICVRLKADCPNFRWYIIGDGQDKENIYKMIQKNSLQNTMILLGAKSNPYPYMKKADLFVLQSYYEGRPIVVDEALIIGTPVLVTNYASAREQVADGEYGYIVNNTEDDIYIKLKEIIHNSKQLNLLRENLANKKWNELEDCTKFLDAIKG